MTPEQKVILAFIERVNVADTDGLVALLAEPHLFIDSLGHVLKGDRRTLTGAWRNYYQLVPDYHIEVEEILQDGDTLMIVGRASGTVAEHGEIRPGNRWVLPAAFRAVVRDDFIGGWQVYCDTTPVQEIMKRIGKG